MRSRTILAILSLALAVVTLRGVAPGTAPVVTTPRTNQTVVAGETGTFTAAAILSPAADADPVLAELGERSLGNIKLADLDRDGRQELILTSVDSAFIGHGRVHVLTPSGAEAPGWPVRLDYHPLNNTAAVGDIDGDGVTEIVVETFGDSSRPFGSQDVQKVWAFDLAGRNKPGFPVTIGQGGAFGSGAMPSPSVADLDGDEASEILAVSMGFAPYKTTRVVAIRGDGTVVFDTTIPRSAPKGVLEYANVSVPMVGNLSGDSSLEVVFGVYSSDDRKVRMYALDSGGSFLPGWPVILRMGAIREVGALGDLDSDGYDEFVMTYSPASYWDQGPPLLWAFNGSGAVLSGFPVALPGSVNLDKVASPPALVDIDGDGNLDVVTGVSDQRSHYLAAYDRHGAQLSQVSVPGKYFTLDSVAVANDQTGHACAVVPILSDSIGSESVVYAMYFDGQLAPGFPFRYPRLCQDVFCNQASSVALARDSGSTEVYGVLVEKSGSVRRLRVFDSTQPIPWGQFLHDASNTGRSVTLMEAAPSVRAHPTDQTVNAGQTASFGATATGNPRPTLRWQVNAQGSTWRDIEGATARTYAFAASVDQSGNRFRAVFLNNLGSATTEAATLTVTLRMPVIAWAKPAAITYGTALSSTQLNATASVAGTFVYTPPAGTVLTVGTHTLSVTFTPTDGANYSGATKSVSLTVQAPPTMTPSPTALNFGAVNSGGTLSSVTPPQTVTVSQSGGDGVAWTVSADVPWLTIAAGDAAGSGSGTFSVGLNNTGNVLPASGTLAGTITITAPGARSNPTIAVTATLYTPATTQPPFGLTSSPAPNAVVQGAVGITGWVLDDVGIDRVRLYRNCLAFEDQASCQWVGGYQVVWMGDATIVAGARPDIEAAYPGYPQNNRAGWGYAMLSNLSPQIPNQQMFGGQGPLTIYIRARDVEGQEAWIGQTFLPGSTTLSDELPTPIVMDNDTIAKPFGTIDTPAQGQTVSGAFWNWGWALTPDSNTTAGANDILIPTDGSTIRVWIDGASPGTVLYNMCRGTMAPHCVDDIASIFGNTTPQPIGTPRAGNPTKFRNLDANRGAIAGFYLNTAGLANGVHTIAWAAFDNATPTPRGDGLGSRYFTVLNTGADIGGTRAIENPRPNAPAVSEDTGARATRAGEVYARTGFDASAPLIELQADADGVFHVQLPEMGRLELQIGRMVQAGHLLVGGEERPLPVGSRLDADVATFTWAPGVGFIGTYRLAFDGTGNTTLIDVTIRPAQAPIPGEGVIRMSLDVPGSGSTVSGTFTVAGWALDPQADIGSGIGAVHVWAQRTDVAGAVPVFLGAASLDGARPDVAGLYGAQFDRPGFNLAAPSLDAGTYTVTAYVWNRRTARWEDARSVILTVR